MAGISGISALSVLPFGAIHAMAAAPTDATYVLMTAHAMLPQRRILTPGAGITVSDGGATNPVTVSVNGDIQGASYVLLGPNATFTNERTLTGTANRIVVTDGGAGGAVTLSPGALIVQTDQGNTFTTGVQQIETGGVNNQALILKMAAGQVENGFEAQNSMGAVLSGADERGILFSDGGTDPTNFFAGPNAGNIAATGTGCVAIGAQSLQSLTSGDRNFGLGTGALAGTTTEGQNVAIGDSAMNVATGSRRCVSIGNFASQLLTTGDDSVSIGTQADQYNQAGSDNVIIGYQAGRVAILHSKSGCVLIGYRAGYDEINSNRLYIANSNTTTPLIYGLFTGAGAGLIIHSQNVAGIPLVVRGIAAQASPLFQLQDSIGGVVVDSGDGLAGSEFAFNQGGIDVDLRVESLTYDAIIVDAGTDALKLMNNAAGLIGFFGAAPVNQRQKANYNNWAAFTDVVDALVDLGLFDAA